jgi:hypothetical protein
MTGYRIRLGSDAIKQGAARYDAQVTYQFGRA